MEETLADQFLSPPVEQLGDEDSKVTLHEAHFVPLRVQSNVYGLVPLQLGRRNKLLVATIRGEIACLEFYSPAAQRPPSLNPINFTYIPGEPHTGIDVRTWIQCCACVKITVDAEVVSIDAIMKEPNGIVVGVTLILSLIHI